MGALTSKRKESSLDGEEISFDHFQVLRAIGKGSFGKVCIVQKRDSKQMFAMKYMNKTQCEARDALNNVFREIEILASLNHPFLVNLWFSFQDSEDMFMVVDLLLGGDLRYHVQQGVQFSDQDVRLYILEVASALAYLHARNIIHRDIKPDNLLLDEEGHVHLTDFNIATVLRSGQLATSMSGTKPYMAPEVFECAAETCEGYSYAVDWWSLGVTAYEVRRGKRPYDIHSNTSLHEIRHMFLQSLKFSPDCHPSLVHVLSRLLVVSPDKRISRLEDLVKIPYVATLDMDTLLQKKCRPAFTPPKDHLNCDPTFELEEMIIESRPLHKKKKRLSKQKSIKETQSSLSGTTEGEALVYEGMLVFNREQEEARKARERREQEWQAELEESMKMSDPTGHGCNFTGSQSGTPVKVRSKGEAGGSGQAEGSSTPAVTSSPTEHTPLTKVTVSPSNVRARIAGSPKVKVRGTTVTIESPRSSSSLTKSSTQQLKERLRELKADRRRQGDSASESEYSDVTQSDDLTLTGRRSPSHSPGKPKRRSVSKSPERSQRRSTSRSPKLSPRKSTSGSPRTPGRSSRKSAGRASREFREASAVPHEGREEATSSSLANEEQPPVASIAQENFREDGDKVLSRPASLPAEVRHEIQEFSKMRISEPPLSLPTTGDNACESSVSTHDQTTSDTTSKTTESSSRDEDDCHKSAEDVPQNTALSNGCLVSTRISRASLEIQDFKLEDKVRDGRAPVLDQGRRHSMEPRRRTTETSKRFSEGHRSSSVTSKANPDTWRRSFESRREVTEPCNNSSDFLRNSSRILKDSVEGGEGSCKRSENSAEAQRKSYESLRRSSNDSSKYSSSGVRTISCDGTEDSSHTHHLTEIQPNESQKSPSGSRGSRNDTSDEGIEITF